MRSARFAVCAVFVAIFLSVSCASCFAQGRPCIVQLQRARLVAPANGWALLTERSPTNATDTPCVKNFLYWTSDDGANWREITPQKLAALNISGGQFESPASDTIFFLDRDHGWLIADDRDPNDGLAYDDPLGHFYLLSTKDGGRHWKRAALLRPGLDRGIGMSPTQTIFTDAKHGWIVWRWAAMNSRLNALTATSDGGRTWSDVAGFPGPGPVQFFPSGEGWMIGNSPDQNGIPITEGDALWRTHDWGKSWTVVQISPAPERSSDLRFYDLKFQSEKEGVVIGTVYEVAVGADDIVNVTCTTHDAGQTWAFSSFKARSADASIIGTHVVWTITDTTGHVRIRNGDNEIAPTLTDGSWIAGRLRSADFLTDRDAWGVANENWRWPGSAFDSVELLATEDGGRTFRVITPMEARSFAASATGR